MNRRAREAAGWRAKLGRWLTAGAASLALHALVLALLLLAGFGRFFATPPKDVKPVALRTVDSSAWASNRKIDPRRNPNAIPAPPEPKRQEPAKEEVKKEALPEDGKIVDVAPGNGEAPDADAQFLAESNNRVEKETMSRDRGLRYKNTTPRPSTPVRPSEPRAGQGDGERQQAAGNGGRGNDEEPARDGQRKGVFEVPSAEKRDRLALEKGDPDGLRVPLRDGSDAVAGNSDRYRVRPGPPEGSDEQGSTGKAGAPKIVTLAPSASVIDKIAGGPASDLTPLDDVEEGEGTYLNTREFKYSGFFNRIKQYVGMNWNPGDAIRQKDPTGEIYLYKDRYTLVSVTLDRGGEVKQVNVDKSSGVDFLDREAVAAFERVHRFPNPPPALTNDRGEIQFTFGFYLEVGNGGLRLFRPRN